MDEFGNMDKFRNTDEDEGISCYNWATISEAPLAGHPLTVNLGESNNLVGNQQPINKCCDNNKLTVIL